jgi:hypothetical protein
MLRRTGAALSRGVARSERCSVAETQNWDEVQQLLLQRWPALDEKAVKDTRGDREGILALLEGRLGYARANAERDYDELLSGESSVAPKDVADDKMHTGTTAPVGDVHGSFDERGNERSDSQAERGASTSARTMVDATSEASRAQEYAEGEQGVSRRESDNSDGKSVPPDMESDAEPRGDERMRRAS